MHWFLIFFSHDKLIDLYKPKLFADDKESLAKGSGPVIESSYIHCDIIQENLLKLKRSIIVLLSPSHFFHFLLVTIIMYKSKTTVFSIQR